jgi:hypothetical protein
MPVRKISNPAIITCKLSEEEIKDPYLVIYRFFDYADLASQREYLWNWLKTMVSGTYSTPLLDKKQRYDMIYTYEHIERLIEAAHLIHLQQLHNKKKKKKKHKE